MAYLPIEEYGIIGDLHSVALVGSNRSIDWLCWQAAAFVGKLSHGTVQWRRRRS